MPSSQLPGSVGRSRRSISASGELAGGAAASQGTQRVQIGHRLSGHPQAGQLFDQALARSRMAVQHDDGEASSLAAGPRAEDPARLAVAAARARRSTPAGLRAHADLSLHQTCQPAADRQPQSGAAESAGTEVALHERLEDFGLLRRAHPDFESAATSAQARSPVCRTLIRTKPRS